MTRILGVAAAQVAPIALDPVATWEKFESEVRWIAARYPAIDLLVFPEMYLPAPSRPGHVGSDGYRETVAETIPGPLSDRVIALARDVGKWLVPGSIIERDGAHLHNTALVASPDGELVATYRKICTWQPFETCQPGNRYVTFSIPDVGRIGLMICYDGWFPEIPRALAYLGAELIVQPTSTLTSDRDQEVLLARANATVNQVFIVSPNTAGSFGPGRSVVVDPEGRVLAEAGSGEEILTQMIDLDAVAMTREYGTGGLNQLWKQLRDSPLPMPPQYMDGFDGRSSIAALGPFRHDPRKDRVPDEAASFTEVRE
jgi:formamidase